MRSLKKSIRLSCVPVLAALLAGCMPPPPPAPVSPFGLVPTSALRVAVGIPPISFATASTGPVYVVDETDQSLITTLDPPHYSGSLLLIDPMSKSITLQGSSDTTKTVLANPINPEHKFSIWATPAHATTQP